MNSSACSKPHCDAVAADPSQDIYPCPNRGCQLFLQETELEHKLYKAAKHFAFDRFAELLNETPTGYVKARYPRGQSEEEKKESLLNLLFSTFFQELSPYAFNVTPETRENIYRLFEIAVTRFPSLINEAVYERACQPYQPRLLEILGQHDPTEKPVDECCYICFGAYQFQMLRSVCQCKSRVHLRCLIRSVETHGPQCTVCRTPIQTARPHRGRRFFPALGVYPDPLMSNYHIVPEEDVFDRLRFAVCFLIVDEVERLLNAMSLAQFRDYVTQADFYAVHKMSPDGWIEIRDMPYTNLSREEFPEEFERIETLLRDMHIRSMLDAVNDQA